MNCEYGAVVETEDNRGKQKYSEKTYPNSTFAAANQKWIGLGSNPTFVVTDRQITI